MPASLSLGPNVRSHERDPSARPPDVPLPSSLGSLCEFCPCFVSSSSLSHRVLQGTHSYSRRFDMSASHRLNSRRFINRQLTDDFVSFNISELTRLESLASPLRRVTIASTIAWNAPRVSTENCSTRGELRVGYFMSRLRWALPSRSAIVRRAMTGPPRRERRGKIVRVTRQRASETQCKEWYEFTQHRFYCRSGALTYEHPRYERLSHETDCIRRLPQSVYDLKN